MRVSFWALLIAVVVVGLGVGGAFAAGMALGRNQAPEATLSGFARPSTTGTPRAGMGGDQFGGFMGINGRPLGTGTVEKIEGNVLTVTTTNGARTFTLADEVTVQKLGTVPRSELKVGERVTLSAPQGSSDKVTSILVLPTAT